MSSHAENGSELSLPSPIRPDLPSSPPLLARDIPQPPGMDMTALIRPEPLPVQDAESLQPTVKQFNFNETECSPPSQQTHDNTRDGLSDSNRDDDPANNDPATQIPGLDWVDLHVRYHAAINKCQNEEHELIQEFDNLMTYFRTWAESGHTQETSRTYHRLQTRSTFVRHSEDALEQKRHHYINVVKAFENALYLAYFPVRPSVGEQVYQERKHCLAM